MEFLDRQVPRARGNVDSEEAQTEKQNGMPGFCNSLIDWRTPEDSNPQPPDP